MGGFLAEPPRDDKVEQMYADDLAGDGYIMNLTRVWAWCPDALEALSDVLGLVSKGAAIDLGDRAVLILAATSTIGDSYCSLAYGLKSTDVSGEPVAIDVLKGRDDNLTPRQEVLARWARKVAAAPNDITRADVDELRSHGFLDGQILGLTVFVAMRVAFSMVNDALGAAPDAELVQRVPPSVRRAVTWGRRSRDAQAEPDQAGTPLPHVHVEDRGA